MDKGVYSACCLATTETKRRDYKERSLDGNPFSYVRVRGRVRPVQLQHIMDFLFYPLTDILWGVQNLALLILTPVSTCSNARFDLPSGDCIGLFVD